MRYLRSEVGGKSLTAHYPPLYQTFGRVKTDMPG
jgi:hypothetical protein